MITTCVVIRICLIRTAFTSEHITENGIQYTVKIDYLNSKQWFLDNLRHREDGPAVEFDNGYKAWYLNGKLYREDGPAAEYSDGSKRWYLNGKLYREDGPAVEIANGDEFWYRNGRLHREDGPAIKYSSGGKTWYLNGKLLPITSNEQFLRMMNLKALL